MGISFSSINTGLPKDIIKQIMAAEKTPILKMEERKARINEKSKLVSELTDLMQKLQNDINKNLSAKAFREMRVITNNELIDVAIDKDLADVGEYRFEVMDLAQKSSALSSSFEDPENSYIGVGFIQYTLPSGEVRDIYVDPDNASLRGVAKLINADPSMGMKANVVNDGSGSDAPWRLSIALQETGNDNYAEFPYFYFVDGEDDFYLDEQREAHNAVVKLDGFEIEVPTNKANELIPGLAINLKKARPGDEFTIKVEEDIKAITEKMNLIIDKINAILNFIHNQNRLDEKSDTTRTLGGDLSLQTLESRIRTSIFTPTMTRGGPRRLSDIGITFQRNGQLAMDTKKFESVTSKNYIVVAELLTGYFDKEEEVRHPGFIENFSKIVDGSIRRTDGILTLRKDGLRKTTDQIDRQIENRQRHLEQKEMILKEKFSRLESAISKIRGQGAGLGALASNVDPIMQLIGDGG